MASLHCDVVLARALAPQPVVLEYAAPLLRMGGALVDWRGRRDPAAEDGGRRGPRRCSGCAGWRSAGSSRSRARPIVTCTCSSKDGRDAGAVPAARRDRAQAPARGLRIGVQDAQIAPSLPR